MCLFPAFFSTHQKCRQFCRHTVTKNLASINCGTLRPFLIYSPSSPTKSGEVTNFSSGPLHSKVASWLHRPAGMSDIASTLLMLLQGTGLPHPFPCHLSCILRQIASIQFLIFFCFLINFFCSKAQGSPSPSPMEGFMWFISLKEFCGELRPAQAGSGPVHSHPNPPSLQVFRQFRLTRCGFDVLNTVKLFF